MPSSTTRKSGRPAGVRVDASLVRRCRERAGLSREELAELIGVTGRTLQRVENEGVAGLTLVKQLCEVLRLPVPALLRADAATIQAGLRAHGLAPSAPPALVGRDAELAALRECFGRRSDHLALVLDGPTGVGKTALAQRLCRDLAEEVPDGVVWLGGDVADVRLAQRDIGRALGFDAHLPAVDGSSGRDWSQALPGFAADGILERVRDRVAAHALSGGHAARPREPTRPRGCGSGGWPPHLSHAWSDPRATPARPARSPAPRWAKQPIRPRG